MEAKEEEEIIIVKIISLHFKNSKVGQVKKHLATYVFVGEMASESKKWS